jgi:hypothetical protein
MKVKAWLKIKSWMFLDMLVQIVRSQQQHVGYHAASAAIEHGGGSLRSRGVQAIHVYVSIRLQASLAFSHRPLPGSSAKDCGRFGKIDMGQGPSDRACVAVACVTHVGEFTIGSCTGSATRKSRRGKGKYGNSKRKGRLDWLVRWIFFSRASKASAILFGTVIASKK